MKKPSKKTDPLFDGEYDLWLDGIRIEVKASRAVDASSKMPLYVKALSTNTKQKFLMNFQQIKPECCDVFILMAVFRDKIVMWIMNRDEIEGSELYSKKQHRGGVEGQLHVKQNNIQKLDKFKLDGKDLTRMIKNASSRLHSN